MSFLCYLPFGMTHRTREQSILAPLVVSLFRTHERLSRSYRPIAHYRLRF